VGAVISQRPNDASVPFLPSIHPRLQYLSLLMLFTAFSRHLRKPPFYIATLLFCSLAQAATNFEQCFSNLQQNGGNITGGTDNNGRPVPMTNATGITYARCVESCGPGQEPFSWGVFSQQFSSWLLPWLALISQLPFGAILPTDNLISVFLTVGSPALAAYSLAITALNGQWVALRFSRYRLLSSVPQVVQILTGLQQAPLRVTNEHGLLASLIVLPENHVWFSELAHWIKHEHTWSISAATSISWVLVAYLFTVVDSFADVTRSINSNGQAVGSIWLWLVPIVVGWLLVAPKIEARKLNDAMSRANKSARVATNQGTVTVDADEISRTKRAFSLATYDSDFVLADELATAPIFNYARFLPWVEAVEEVAFAYHHACDKLSRNIPVDSLNPLNGSMHMRYGTLEQVEKYCRPDDESPLPQLHYFRGPTCGPGVLGRFFIASAMALSLQWATPGSAIIILWYTPTKGLACRSAAYMGYGALSTVVWAMMVSSSFLSHAARLRCAHHDHTRPAQPSSPRSATFLMKLAADWLRRAGKVLATLNAFGLIVICVFQFSNFFDTCFCNSSVFYWRERAYNVIVVTDASRSSMKLAWILGLALALSGVFGFIGFIKLHTKPQIPH
jgi:hypothetical protein